MCKDGWPGHHSQRCRRTGSGSAGTGVGHRHAVRIGRIAGLSLIHRVVLARGQTGTVGDKCSQTLLPLIGKGTGTAGGHTEHRIMSLTNGRIGWLHRNGRIDSQSRRIAGVQEGGGIQIAGNDDTVFESITDKRNAGQRNRIGGRIRNNRSRSTVAQSTPSASTVRTLLPQIAHRRTGRGHARDRESRVMTVAGSRAYRLRGNSVVVHPQRGHRTGAVREGRRSTQSASDADLDERAVVTG